jgi:DNA polymerase III epsilon subunit-like protein
MLAIIVDIETTGLLVSSHRPVEVAAVVLDENHKEIASWSSLAHPGNAFVDLADPEAMEIHRIPLAEILAAPPAAEVAKSFEAFLDKHWGALLFAFNVEFEKKFLSLDPWLVSDKKWGDCLMLSSMREMSRHGAAKVSPTSGRVKWPKQSEAADFFKVKLDPAALHRALPDARVAAAIYAGIMKDRTRRIEVRVASEEETNLLDQGY